MRKSSSWETNTTAWGQVATKCSNQRRLSKSKSLEGSSRKKISAGLAKALISWILRVSPPDRLARLCRLDSR